MRAEDHRALQSVKSIHTAYAASRSGTVQRDDALWAASIQLTPSPREEFWMARRGGLAVAYARAALVDDVLTITELGRFEDGAGALAKLISSLLEPRAEDALAHGPLASEELRSFLVLPTFDDIGLTVALEQRGIRSHPMDDSSASFRCVNLIGLAARLDVDLLPDEDGTAFLQRILPPDGMVFWPLGQILIGSECSMGCDGRCGAGWPHEVRRGRTDDEIDRVRRNPGPRAGRRGMCGWIGGAGARRGAARAVSELAQLRVE